MDIKLIALDLDGTLLDSEKRLSERNLQALQRCIEKGVEIVPATGRTVDGIPDFIKEIPGIRYAITTNGAVILNLITGDEIDSRRLPKELVLEIIEKTKPYPVIYDAYVDGRGKLEEGFYSRLDEFHIPPVIQSLIHETRDMIPSILEYLKNYDGMVEKVNMFFRDEETRYEVRGILEEIPHILVSSSLSNNLEINYEDAAKGEAILRLASYLGLKQSETMACGDGENDINMIEKVGFGVVMSNAEEYLKGMADYITGSNEESGVAMAIEKFVL